jgi:hypothetical protein
MKAFALLTFASVLISACSFHSDTVVQKPPPAPAPVVVTNPPPPGTVVVPAD